ncbi:MAG: hypothetical protein SFU86_09715 [Pirellulaceae bacterium]|nr:hypothetical protein [Pirellulaceae bacterium]
MSEPTPNSPQWSSDLFRDAASQPGNAPKLGRGLIGHVPVVAMLLIGVGLLEVTLAGFMLVFAGLATLVPPEAGEFPTAMVVFVGVLSLPAAVCGVLRVVAGVYNLRFRRRTLGMVALVAGLATVFTFYCAPTSIALGIYGLIVYLNDSVTEAFALGDQGKTQDEIRRAFP